MCSNHAQEAICNWLVPADDPNPFCLSCRLNRIIPDLGIPKNRVLWERIERAKRRLVYTLLQLRLPIVDRDADPERGLGFQFMADSATKSEFTDAVGKTERVMTGHRSGVITINIAEADPSAREEIREKMNEQYRTLLGHFRHEIGHYYWDRLIVGTDWLTRARALFGDERGHYGPSLARYYRDGPQPDWPLRFISAYASAHPHEDWAETWAHYLHMVDTLETAHDFGFSVRGRRLTPPPTDAEPPAPPAWRTDGAFDTLLADWIDLTLAMNALNRSMGLPDAYPFVLSPTATDKLRFVHELIRAAGTGG